MGEKTIGRGRGGHSTWSSPPLFMVDYYCWSRVKGKWGKPQKQVENRTPEHVPCCHVSARIRRMPVPFPPGTKSTWGLEKSTLNFLPVLHRFWNSDSTRKTWRRHQIYSESPADTPSTWAYLFSPLKVIRVTGSVGWSCKPTVGSHRRCHGQLLL